MDAVRDAVMTGALCAGRWAPSPLQGAGLGLLWDKEQMPTWAFQEKGACCQGGWHQAGSLGSQAALEHGHILPKYFFQGVSAISCHSFLLEHP